MLPEQAARLDVQMPSRRCRLRHPSQVLGNRVGCWCVPGDVPLLRALSAGLLAVVAGCGAGAGIGPAAPPGSPAAPPHSAAAAPAIAAPTGDALERWASFPVEAEPRPVVLTGEAVLAPGTGFTSGDAKISFMTGRFAAPPDLSPSPRVEDGRSLLTAAEAYRALAASQQTPVLGEPSPPTPVAVGSPTLGHARFGIDRGERELPAWRFAVEGARDPASVLALRPADYVATDGRGGSSGSTVAFGADDRTLTVTYVGSPPGPPPCGSPDAAIQPHESRTAVELELVMPTPAAFSAPTGDPSTSVGCPAVGAYRTAAAVLAAPLGNRIVVDDQGRPLPRT